MMNQVSLFSASNLEAQRDRYRLTQDLRHALINRELVMYYQPVFDCRQRRMVSAEALLRWNHPKRGLLSPATFIPLAEQSNLINEIGRWTIRTVCDQARAWLDNSITDFKVAVNLSARQFNDSSLVDFTRQALFDSRIGPAVLEIELTETAAMADFQYTLRMFTKLRELGVSVAIDDFGMGYSNLSYLSRLPFDRLKIDRTFVRHVADNANHSSICKALITLAEGLGLEVTAEGTETREEVETLVGYGCYKFQGYYFSRPQPADELSARLHGVID